MSKRNPSARPHLPKVQSACQQCGQLFQHYQGKPRPFCGRACMGVAQAAKYASGRRHANCSDFNSVDIRWTDGPTSDQVKEIVKKYQAGSFNGMEDIYENNPDATFADVFGDPNYVNCQRSYTLQGIKAAWMLAGRDVKEIPEDYCENGWKMPNDGGRRIREVWSDTSL